MRQPPFAARRRNRPATARGVMLLEVLISVLIFSIGLLGLVALQARAYQYAASAEDTNRAALLANEIVSAMWTARAASVPDAVYAAWQSRVAAPTVDGLPNGVGRVDSSTSPPTVSITWRAPNAAAAAAPNRFITQAVIP